MKLFKIFKAKDDKKAALKPLEAKDVAAVSGGLNPQPLPPYSGRSFRY